MKTTVFRPKNIAQPRNRYLYPLILVLLIFVTFGAVESMAQKEDELPEGVVPPPLSMLAEDEKEQLEEVRSAKRRTRLAIELMEARLNQSEEFAIDERFQDSLDQLGGFRGLMNKTLNDLRRNEYGRRSLNNNKKFEIALRQFIPRLELVRRALPFSHGYHVVKLIKDVREARRETIEPFFGETVLGDGE